MHESSPDREKLFSALQSWRIIADFAQKGQLTIHRGRTSDDVRALLGDDLGILHSALPPIPESGHEKTMLSKLCVAELGTFTAAFPQGTGDVTRGFCTIPSRYLTERPFDMRPIEDYLHATAVHLEHPVAVMIRGNLNWEPMSDKLDVAHWMQMSSNVPEVVNATMFRIPKN